MDMDGEAESSSDELQEPKIFDGLTAWFSTSVAEKRKHLWVKNDGMLCDWETALYVFSEDASTEDTGRLFESEAYLREHLAVFHPIYIDECLRQGNMKHVTLGKFLILPADVHKVIGTKSYWELLVQKEKDKQEKTPSKQSNQKATGKTPSPRPSTSTGGKTGRTKPVSDEPESHRHAGTPARRSTPRRSTPQRSGSALPSTKNKQTGSISGKQNVEGPVKRKLYNEENSSQRDGNCASQQNTSPKKKSKKDLNHMAEDVEIAEVEVRSTGDAQEKSGEVRSTGDAEPYKDYVWVHTLPQVKGTITEFVIGQDGCSIHAALKR